jgi:plastocyanin
MTRSLRFLVLTAVLGAAVAATAATAASTRAAAPMRVTVDIFPAGHDEITQPANIAVRAGGTVEITFRNHTQLQHTFTIKALGISVLIQRAAKGSVKLTTVSFVAPYGVYEWRCMFCAGGAHPHMHAMGGKVYAIVNA